MNFEAKRNSHYLKNGWYWENHNTKLLLDDKIVFSEKQFDGRMKENGEPCLLFNVKSNDFSDEINLKRYK